MDQTLALENDPKMRETWNVKTNEEVREEFRNIFEDIGEPVKIVFNDKRCLDCGAIGDPRLLPKFCHMKRAKVHRVRHPKLVHPLEVESFHPEDIPIKTHPGYMHNSPWYKSLRKKQIYSCCGGKLTSSGCALKWKCCGQQHRINNQLPERNSLPVFGLQEEIQLLQPGSGYGVRRVRAIVQLVARGTRIKSLVWPFASNARKNGDLRPTSATYVSINVADIVPEPKVSVPKVKDQF